MEFQNIPTDQTRKCDRRPNRMTGRPRGDQTGTPISSRAARQAHAHSCPPLGGTPTAALVPWEVHTADMGDEILGGLGGEAPAVTRLRVVVADDDVLMREGVASLLERSG